MCTAEFMFRGTHCIYDLYGRRGRGRFGYVPFSISDGLQLVVLAELTTRDEGRSKCNNLISLIKCDVGHRVGDGDTVDLLPEVDMTCTFSFER